MLKSICRCVVVARKRGWNLAFSTGTRERDDIWDSIFFTLYLTLAPLGKWSVRPPLSTPGAAQSGGAECGCAAGHLERVGGFVTGPSQRRSADAGLAAGIVGGREGASTVEIGDGAGFSAPGGVPYPQADLGFVGASRHALRAEEALLASWRGMGVKDRR